MSLCTKYHALIDVLDIAMYLYVYSYDPFIFVDVVENLRICGSSGDKKSGIW